MWYIVEHLLEVLELELWVGVVERPKMGWWPSEQWIQQWFQTSVWVQEKWRIDMNDEERQVEGLESM